MSKKFAVLRFKKLKSKGAVIGGLKHNLRQQPTPNANPDVKNLYGNERMRTVDACMAHYDKRLGDQKVRKNAVYGHEALVTGSPERMHAMSEEEQIAYFKDALAWLNELHGGSKNLISVAIHFDEQTPHLHAVYIPLDEKGKLNCNGLIGGGKRVLSRLQTEFAEKVGAKHGLARGMIKSPAKHKTIKEFYSHDIPDRQKEAEKLSNEISALNNELIGVAGELADMKAQRGSMAIELEELSSKVKSMKEMTLDEAEKLVDELREEVRQQELMARGISRPGR